MDSLYNKRVLGYNVRSFTSETAIMTHADFSKYDITKSGEVFSLDYNHTGKRGIIKQMLKRGYPTVGITNDCGVRKYRPVHRLVAETHIENPDNRPQVNHIDGDKKNNHISNLEWCTAQHNIQHAFDSGLSRYHSCNINGNSQGSKLPQSKLTEDIVATMRQHHKDHKGIDREPWKKYGISRNTFWYAISKTSKNRTWKHVPYPD